MRGKAGMNRTSAAKAILLVLALTTASLALAACTVGVATFKGTFDLNAPVQQVDQDIAGGDAATDDNDP
jgi:hypothetical protein